MIAYCLADFFNLALWKYGRHPSYADIRGGIEDLVAASLDAMAEAQVRPRELLIRLYGGWHGERLESRVPLREITSAVVREFPSRSGPRLRVQLAEAPVWNQSLRLLRTLRSVPLRSPGGTISTPGGCPHAGSCSLPSLARWWRGRCPDASCAIRLSDLGFTNRQKMVDTLLTADAMAVVRDALADVLIVASDDDDMVPALLALAVSEVKGIRMRRKRLPDDYYDGILAMQGLHTHTW